MVHVKNTVLLNVDWIKHRKHNNVCFVGEVRAISYHMKSRQVGLTGHLAFFPVDGVEHIF